MKRRLTVFISSTYEDLLEERNAALRAVLEAGHVPAGMELFPAGNASQWETIKRWIDACDAFMLILGGRYGSLEPTSDKAYVELEYDYAQDQGKHVFALVLSPQALDAKLRTLGAKATDAHGEKLEKFRERVTTRMSAMVADAKDIQIGALKALIQITDEAGSLGSVPFAEFAALEGELRALRAENERLKESATVDGGSETLKDKKHAFERLCKTLEAERIDPSLGQNVLDALMKQSDLLAGGISGAYLTDEHQPAFLTLCPRLHIFGLMTKDSDGYELNEAGRALVAALKARAAGFLD